MDQAELVNWLEALADLQLIDSWHWDLVFGPAEVSYLIDGRRYTHRGRWPAKGDPMNLSKILEALRSDRAQIDAVIHLLENPIGHRPQRRPPETRRVGAFPRVEKRLADAVSGPSRVLGIFVLGLSLWAADQERNDHLRGNCRSHQTDG